MKSIAEANKTIHSVESQWHYDLMKKYGFVPIDKEQTGLVRSYLYEHSETGYKIECKTGVNADYFLDLSGKIYTENNYYGQLEEHLKSIT